MVEYVITVITYGQYGDLVYKKWIIGYLCDKSLGKHHKLITVKPQPYNHVISIKKFKYAEKMDFCGFRIKNFLNPFCKS